MILKPYESIRINYLKYISQTNNLSDYLKNMSTS